MSSETKTMAITLLFAVVSTLLFILLLRVTDHYEARELIVKEYCIEKGLRPNFCKEGFNDHR